MYLMQYRYWVLLALALTIGSNLLALIGPMLSGYAIDAIELGVGNVDFPRVFYYAGMMVVFYLFSSVLSYVLAVLMIHISRKVVYQMREDVFTHLMELPVGYFDTHQTGDIISRISYDIDTVNTSCTASPNTHYSCRCFFNDDCYFTAVGVDFCFYGAIVHFADKADYRKNASSVSFAVP